LRLKTSNAIVRTGAGIEADPLKHTLAALFLVVLTVLIVLLSPPAWAVDSSETLPACGGVKIEVTLKGDTQSISHDVVDNWIKRAVAAVCTYYGRFPLAGYRLNVQVRGGPGVHGGVTYPYGEGGLTRISLGPGTTAADLDQDWMLTHEMLHLAFPYMAEEHHWIEEGIAVYVEPIARVQAGQLSAAEMWRDVVRDMPKGQPESGDRGLDRTHTWGRTYWGGAMFCLVADVRIREQTHNRKGLQDALRAILDGGGVITNDWPIEQALAVGDKATGTTVLSDLYRETRDKPAPVDLAALWQKLGVERKSDDSVALNASAPLASAREAITRPPK
jgi:hypothetical protein